MVRRLFSGLGFSLLTPRVEARPDEPVIRVPEPTPSVIDRPFIVRRAVSRDVKVLAALWREMMEFHQELDPAFHFGPGAQAAIEKHLLETIRSTDGRVFVAQAGDRVEGYILGEIQARKPIYPSGRYGFISDLSVTREWRRNGIGRALVSEMTSWFEQHGVTAIELFILERNPVSTAFWESLGFRQYLRLLRHDLEQTESAPDRKGAT